jgi:hypothetical protein
MPIGGEAWVSLLVLDPSFEDRAIHVGVIDRSGRLIGVGASPSITPRLDASNGGCADWQALVAVELDGCTRVVVRRKLSTGALYPVDVQHTMLTSFAQASAAALQSGRPHDLGDRSS